MHPIAPSHPSHSVLPFPCDRTATSTRDASGLESSGDGQTRATNSRPKRRKANCAPPPPPAAPSPTQRPHAREAPPPSALVVPDSTDICPRRPLTGPMADGQRPKAEPKKVLALCNHQLVDTRRIIMALVTNKCSINQAVCAVDSVCQRCSVSSQKENSLRGLTQKPKTSKGDRHGRRAQVEGEMCAVQCCVDWPLPCQSLWRQPLCTRRSRSAGWAERTGRSLARRCPVQPCPPRLVEAPAARATGFMPLRTPTQHRGATTRGAAHHPSTGSRLSAALQSTSGSSCHSHFVRSAGAAEPTDVSRHSRRSFTATRWPDRSWTQASSQQMMREEMRILCCESGCLSQASCCLRSAPSFAHTAVTDHASRSSASHLLHALTHTRSRTHTHTRRSTRSSPSPLAFGDWPVSALRRP